MKPGTLLKYHPSTKESWLGVLLEYHPPRSPDIAWVRILWENGRESESYWGYKNYEKEWEILS